MSSNEVNRLKNLVDSELQKIESKNDEELMRINEDIKQKIDHFIDMSETVDNKRSNIYNFSLQYMVFQAMLATIIIATIESVFKFVPLMIVFSQMVLALIVIFKYIKQDKCEYIFVKHEELKDYSNKWKWFYYGNPHISKIKIKSISKVDFLNSAEEYLKGLAYVVENYSKDSLKEDVKNNLQQLYLLQVHNYYKNKFYMELAQVYKNIFLFAVIGATLGFLVA